MDKSEFYILNGDSLSFRLTQLDEKIICRECLIDGPVKADSLNHFFELRAKYLQKTYKSSYKEYQEKVVGEMDRVRSIPNGSIVHLWFEQDLFCQVNLWFMIDLLIKSGKELTLNLVLPIKDSWKGFGALSNEELQASFEDRKTLSTEDTEQIIKLWKAYQINDQNALKESSVILTKIIPHIKDVVKAHLDRFSTNGSGRPQATLNKLIDEFGQNDFSNIFKRFSEIEGIYGFGDLQVKNMLNSM